MEGRCDAFYVRINAETTIDEKRRILTENRHRMAAMKQLHPELKEWQVKLLMIKEKMAQMVNIGKWQDRWVEHPFPNMGEPEKAMCYLTDIQGYDEDHLAWLYNKASLHAIDRFFMQVRRRLSLLERPISSSASLGRRWFGYGPYKPVMVGKLLDIFRVFYNFNVPDFKTGAIHLGHRIPGILIPDKCHESKSPGASGITVTDDLGFGNFPVKRKGLPQAGIRRVPTESSHK
jgi:hypothetical protein